MVIEKYFDIHANAHHLGPANYKGLPIFHAMSGCDCVSSMSGIGYKTVWAAFDNTLAALANNPESVNVHFPMVERFIVLAYDRNSQSSSVNETRKHLLTNYGRTIQNIPPTEGALEQHT